MLSKKTAALVTVGLAGLMAATAIASGVRVRGVDEALTTSTSPLERASAIAGFSAFSDASLKSSSAVAATSEFNEEGTHGSRMDPAETRLVATDSDSDVYLMTDGDTICFQVKGKTLIGAAGCTDPVVASAGQGLVSSTYKLGDRERVLVLAPDAVKEVEFATANGESQVVTLRNNVALLSFDSLPESVSWTTPNGERRTQKY